MKQCESDAFVLGLQVTHLYHLNSFFQVANFQDSSYHLKDLHYTDLDVDTWPFYSEAEKDLVKRYWTAGPINNKLTCLIALNIFPIGSSL